MNDPLQNKFNMVGTCLTFADGEDNLPIWQNKDPLDLTDDMATLHTLHADAAATAADLAGATTGVAAGKDAFETVLEDRAFLLTRATFNHCRKTGDATTAGKVNYTKSAIQRLRDQDLLATTRNIRDAAQAKSTEPNAAKRGITTAAITGVNDAINDYAPLVNAPRSTTVSRAALLRELTTQVAACVDHIRSMDDLVIQLTGEGAPEFIAGWKQARQVVDAGHGPGEDETPTPTGTPPTA
jgi:hypothetical protein